MNLHAAYRHFNGPFHDKVHLQRVEVCADEIPRIHSANVNVFELTRNDIVNGHDNVTLGAD